METKTLTHKELKDKLLSLSGVMFFSMKAITKNTDFNKGNGKSIPKMAETLSLEFVTTGKEVENPTFIDPENIKKHTYMNALLTCGDVTYEQLVNNRLYKEATAKQDPDVIKIVGGEPPPRFEAQEHKWAEKLSNAVSEKDGKFYLNVLCVSANKPSVHNYYNGVEINVKDSKFDLWRKPAKVEGARQGTENPIIYRNYGFSSIQEITLLGETFKIVE